jgi:hypothetical protein
MGHWRLHRRGNMVLRVLRVLRVLGLLLLLLLWLRRLRWLLGIRSIIHRLVAPSHVGLLLLLSSVGAIPTRMVSERVWLRRRLLLLLLHRLLVLQRCHRRRL